MTVTTPPADRAQLAALLAERNQYPERAAAIDARIVAGFERQAAILVLDLCGFSQRASRDGIIHFLAIIHQMEQAASPAIECNRGVVVKQEADNLFARFASPGDALEAALDIQRAFAAMNAVLPEDRALHASIGIGFGPLLLVGAHDVFGNEMNHACKLGEDVAGRDEILLTAAAHAAVEAGRYEFGPGQCRVGGQELGYWRYVGRAEPLA